MHDLADRLLDQVLVLRCQAGDDRAFEELVQRFGVRLRYYVARLAGSPNGVEDVLQDVWVDVYRNLGRLRSPGALRVWLYRIARDKAFRRLRERTRRPQALDELEALEARRDEPRFSASDAERVHACLDRLTAEHREVLALRFLEQMTYEDIARVVGCPLGTVRSRLHHAKLALRREMERTRDDR